MGKAESETTARFTSREPGNNHLSRIKKLAEKFPDSFQKRQHGERFQRIFADQINSNAYPAYTYAGIGTSSISAIFETFDINLDPRVYPKAQSCMRMCEHLKQKDFNGQALIDFKEIIDNPSPESSGFYDSINKTFDCYSCFDVDQVFVPDKTFKFLLEQNMENLEPTYTKSWLKYYNDNPSSQAESIKLYLQNFCNAQAEFSFTVQLLIESQEETLLDLCSLGNSAHNLYVTRAFEVIVDRDAFDLISQNSNDDLIQLGAEIETAIQTERETLTSIAVEYMQEAKRTFKPIRKTSSEFGQDYLRHRLRASQPITKASLLISQVG